MESFVPNVLTVLQKVRKISEVVSTNKEMSKYRHVISNADIDFREKLCNEGPSSV